MFAYLIKRLVWIPVIVFTVITIIFLLTHIAPGSAVHIALGPYATGEQIERLTKQYGLDEPLWVQYGIYIWRLLHGDLGESIVRHKPVSEEILTFLPASVELVFFAMIFITGVGVTLGVVAATNKDRFLDIIGRGIAVAGVSMPQFWLGLMLLLFFSFGLGLLPTTGRIDPAIGTPTRITGMYILDSILTGNWVALKSSILHIVLPAFTLGITSLSTTTRLTRDGVLKVLREDYIAMARAYGFSERTVNYKYALRNGIIPALTNLGMTAAALFGGAFLVETVFSFPGIGYYATTSIIHLDYAPCVGVAIVISLLYILFNLVVDLSYLLIDPRIRF